jgi:tetratricopeptide (TPR) repeat protein
VMAARYRLCVLLIIALAGPACGAELTADEVVDRMLAANRAWLKPEISSVSYTRTSPCCGNTQTTVRFRAPRNLRAEWKAEHAMLLLPGGRGFREGSRVAPEEWKGTRVRDWVMGGLVFQGAAWRLANHREQCTLSDLRREQVDGRDAYHLTVRSPYLPDFESSGSVWPDRVERDELWIDAESFRPLREAESWAVAGRAEESRRAPTRRVTRYTRYQAFPAGGQAPMRLEQWSNWPADRRGNGDPASDPSSVSDYQVVDKKLWCLRSSIGQGHNPSNTLAEVRDVSLARVPARIFYDVPLLRRLERAAALYEETEDFRSRLAWDDVYRLCEQILALGEGVSDAAENAFYLYFWHGEYAKAIEVSKRARSVSQLMLAWAYDAVGDRERALALYTEMKKPGQQTARWPEVAQGLKEPWVPIIKRLEPTANERLVKPGPNWSVSSHPGGLTPEAAIDGNRHTRWMSEEAQQPGMWFQVDLGAPTKLCRVAFDFAGDLSLDYHGYPRRYVVELSADGATWRTVAQADGLRDDFANVAFKPSAVRCVRIRQEGTEPWYAWDIREIYFYAPK